jgi:glycosyltransferase involved in cell wall biosynthesis
VHLVDFHSGDPDPNRRHAASTRMFADWMLGCGFNVVLGNTLNSFFAIDAAREAGLASVWTIHESVDYRTYFGHFGPYAIEPALRAFTHPYQVIFVAHATRKLFEPLNTEHNFHVIHVGLKRDTIEQFMASCTPQEARATIGCPLDKRVVTIVGSVCERKGQQVFAQAALALVADGRRDAVFYIVGCRPSPYQEALKAMVQEYGSEIRLISETPDVHLYYRSSDVFVCCSTIESYPAVILEAMAFQLPIVTTPVFGIAEQVIHEVSALTFRPGDVAQLAAHLRRLLDSPSERQRLGDGASAALNTIISHEEMVQAYEELLLEAFVAGVKVMPCSMGLARRRVA